MTVKKSERASDSGAEERFAQLFCEAFGEEKGQFVYIQHPFVDIYGNHRTIDFAVRTEEGKVAFEIDGETWHNPGKVSQDKYADDLLKQNSMVFQGWRVFRWTDMQLAKTPDRVKDELITFLGYSPVLTYFDGDTPAQQGSVFELREHQEEALASLIKMREEGKTIALVQGATGSGKSAIGVLDAKQVGKRVLFLAHTKELVEQGAANFERLWSDVTVGRFYESFHDTDTYVVCGSIQSIIRNLDILCIDSSGSITKSAFEPAPTSSKHSRYSGFGGWYGYYDDYLNEYEEALLAYCNCYGVDSSDVELLLEYGYTCDEIEEMLMDHSLLHQALSDIKDVYDDKLCERYCGVF